MGRRAGHLLAIAWTLVSVVRVQLRLRGRKVEELGTLAPPWRLNPSSTPWVKRAARIAPATCLQRALVLQEWFRAHGDPRDVVIGVTAPSAGFKAHAWLDGLEEHADYHELERRPVPGSPSLP